ncbi:HAD domain-containing protein [Aquimarina rubra]|uniref:HAD domain-containing protein n=1 Tax=Aquimarina rubra TaxID=1920033 RepID=A0ABW5LE07_9FLAO
MKNLIILDLDGVLILTPNWKSDEMHSDGYSEFNGDCVRNLNSLMDNLDAELWLSSTRRLSKDLKQFQEIFKNRNIKAPLVGFLPGGTLGTERKIEIDTFLDHEPIRNFLIIDDDKSLNGLESDRKQFWVQTELLIGFNAAKLNEAQEIIKQWV